MVSSLKRSHSSRMDLHLGSREFLRVFTDAANHIPRHRRTKFVVSYSRCLSFAEIISSFFIHLVDVLGPTDYLAPVCLLLIEKAANRVIRQSPDEARSTFALPLSLLHHYPSVLQLNVRLFGVLLGPSCSSHCIRFSLRCSRKVTDLLPERKTRRILSHRSLTTTCS